MVASSVFNTYKTTVVMERARVVYRYNMLGFQQPKRGALVGLIGISPSQPRPFVPLIVGTLNRGDLIAPRVMPAQRFGLTRREIGAIKAALAVTTARSR